MPHGIRLSGRTARRVVVLSSLTVLLALVFGASLVVAQGRIFMPWSGQSSGSQDLSSLRHLLKAVAGQYGLGVTNSDEYRLEMGFHTGVLVGPEAFASLAADLALTPTATPEPAATESPTPEPTEEAVTPTEEPAESTETPEATSTATPTLVPTVQRPRATATRTPRTTATSVPPPTATREPIVIVVTSPPRPSPTPEPPPAAPATSPTPLVIVVTSVPPSVPDTPDSPVGGLCSAPGSSGPLPLDLGLLMILAAPLALWRFGSRS